MNTMQTRSVLAAAYPGGRKSNPKSKLTHAVEIDESGLEVRVLCGRVELDHIVDEYGQDTTLTPTCARCAKKDPRTHE